MKRWQRIAAALAVAGLCVPGTFLRSEVSREFPTDIALTQIADAAQTDTAGWSVGGVWQYATEPSLRFGGFSALIPVGEGRLRAFSDRGVLFTFTMPDRADEAQATRRLAGLPFDDPALYPLLWDIESATRDPADRGDYWVGFENTHAIHRFSYRTEPEALRMLDDEVEWYANGGLEAMVRLSDGRFLALPERAEEGLIFAGDPVEGAEATAFPFTNPAAGFAATDMAQLPDGRVLILMRALAWDIPSFASLIAIAEPPQAASEEAWEPRIALRLDGVIPPENYEGLAVQQLDDGRVAVWVMSDDNFSVLQRTLLAKLVFDPAQAVGD